MIIQVAGTHRAGLTKDPPCERKPPPSSPSAYSPSPAERNSRPPHPPPPRTLYPKIPSPQLAWLVGGVWKADAGAVGQGKMRIETRYVWSDNDKFIRFTTHFITDRGELKNYDGNLYWDPTKKGSRRLVYERVQRHHRRPHDHRRRSLANHF